MGKKIKALSSVFGVTVAVAWHHQATVFQRHVKEYVSIVHQQVGSAVQPGDVIVSKYLFRVEFKKPQIDITKETLDRLEAALHDNHKFLTNSLKKRFDEIWDTFRLTCRLADRLVVSYNPFWQEISITPMGDGELSLQTPFQKIDWLALEQNESNQSKIKICLSPSAGIRKLQRFFYGGKNQVFLSVHATCRNRKITSQENQEVIYTQNYNLLKLDVEEEWVDKERFYSFSLTAQTDGAQFGESLLKVWPSLEALVLGGRTDNKLTGKGLIQCEEGKIFLKTLASQMVQEGVDLKELFKTLPSSTLESQWACKNDVVDLDLHYKFDYYPHKNHFAINASNRFQAYKEWPKYFEKLCILRSQFSNITARKGEPRTQPLWQRFLTNLQDKGTIQTAMVVELKDLGTDKFQAQGKIELGLDQCSMEIRGDYSSPPVVKVDIHFNNHDQLVDKLHSYVLSTLEGNTGKVAELILPGLKSSLLRSIQELSVSQNKDNPKVRTIPIQFDSQKQILEIAGESVSSEILDLFKMLKATTTQYDFLKALQKLW